MQSFVNDNECFHCKTLNNVIYIQTFLWQNRVPLYPDYILQSSLKQCSVNPIILSFLSLRNLGHTMLFTLIQWVSCMYSVLQVWVIAVLHICYMKRPLNTDGFLTLSWWEKGKCQLFSQSMKVTASRNMLLSLTNILLKNEKNINKNG